MFAINLSGSNILIVFGSTIVGLYFYLSRHFNYWKSRGIKGPSPIVGLGTLYQLFKRDMFNTNLYNVQNYGKIHGIFMGDKPALVLAEPELIKQIAIKDFHLFADRSDLVTGDPMNDRALFNLLGEEWKKMRSIISPTFSSAKMRKMHPIIVDCVERLQLNLEKEMKTNNEVEVKHLMSNFTIDAIACCAFGTKIDTYAEKKTEFNINAQKAFKGSWRTFVFFSLSFISPRLIQMFKFSVFDPKVTNFFRQAIRSIISLRESEKGEHNDYLQLMINARNPIQDSDEPEADDNTEQIFRQSDDKQIVKNTKVKGVLSEDDILATSFIFFVAGFETTAATLGHLIYSLAMNEDIQQRLYEEVNKYGPNFSYEDIEKMPYLEACVAETLRLYNAVPFASRMASQEYKLGDTGITIPKGMLVNFDIHTIHHSSEYYEEPNKFNPDRFLPENRDKLVPYTYLPFGMGPRICVGMRFALMEAKTAAAFLISKYRFFKTANTEEEIKPKKYEFILTSGDIHIGMELRN